MRVIGAATAEEDRTLAVSSYKPDYVKTCHDKLAAQLAEFRALPAGKPKDVFAPGYFNAMVLVLDS